MPIVERSYGIIPLSPSGSHFYVLMVLQQDKEGKALHWSFPKGSPEPNESPLETALRECHEETGILIQKEFVKKDESFVEEYRFFKDGSLYTKYVEYFPGFIKGTEIPTPKENDVAKARWVTLSAARDLTEFSSKKRLIEEIADWLKKQDKTA